MLINDLREHQIARGVPPAEAYRLTMYVLAAVLAFGFVCNGLIRPARTWGGAR